MRVSIITVCFNSDKTITETLRSTRSQDYLNFEHIIVDGGSADNTLAVVAEEIAPNHKIISERDKGIYDAMNKGVSRATGDIIGFINSDDFYPSPDVLSRVVAAFNSSGADACYGDLCYVSQADPSKIVRYWRSSSFQLGFFGKGWCPPHPTFFVRRDIYNRLGGFDLSFKIAADVELMARFLEVGRISSHYIPEVLVHMRMGGISNRSLTNTLKLNLEIRQGLLSLGLRFSWFRFLGFKLFSRFLQFISRPT
jgi:glycosyltransferase involved in cell wall biosynthesis